MPNWNEINRCGIWKVLGVSECDDCPTCKKCWGDEVELPEPHEELMDRSLPISALVEPEGFGEREFFAEADNEQSDKELIDESADGK